MTDLNPVDPNQVTTVCSTSSCGCSLGRMKTFVRAVLYVPLILLVGTYAAVAMFPELAEYATPLIGNSRPTYTPDQMKNNCPFSHGGCQSEHELTLASGCRMQSSCHASADQGCCSSSCPFSTQSEDDTVDALAALTATPTESL
ncbi:MAG: hypothetical protein FJ267_03320 [Planctomycetes bacterium]|nr:hypothetical protein [Planctomycetota bacterium]